MMIVLLNFLVAIISQVYEEDMVMETQNTYKQRCEMNLEVDEVLRLLGFRQTQDLYILSANFTEEDNANEGEEWQGYVQKSR